MNRNRILDVRGLGDLDDGRVDLPETAVTNDKRGTGMDATERLRILVDQGLVERGDLDDTGGDIDEIVQNCRSRVFGRFTLVRLGYRTSGDFVSASVSLQVGDAEKIYASGEGVDPVRAACNAIDKISGLHVHIMDWSCKLEGGLFSSFIRIKEGDIEITRSALHKDNVRAHVLAYLSAINQVAQNHNSSS